MTEEIDMRVGKKARALAPLFLLLAVVFTTAYFSGCGGKAQLMDLSEYKKSISELHDGVAWDLGYALETLGSLDFTDYYHLADLQSVFQGAYDIFAAAYTQADSLYPPREAEPLHLDLLHFYGEGQEEMGILVNSMGLFQVVLPMLADVENLALPSLADEAQLPEVKAAAEEDHRTMDMYLQEIEGMVPPPDLEEFLDQLRGFFQSLRDAAVAVEQTTTQENREAFSQLRQRWPSQIDSARLLQGRAEGYLMGLGGRIDALIEKGRELASRIQEL